MQYDITSLSSSVMNFFFALLIASLPLPVGELLDRRFRIEAHLARKVSHLLGTAAACSIVWLIPRWQIAVIGGLFFGVLAVVRRYKLVASLYKIKRRTYGELCFPLGIVTAALLSTDTSSYLAIMLIMGLADTVADIVGSRFARHHYRILGGKKSWQGNAAFLVTALVVLLACQVALLPAVGIALAATCAEAVSGLGTDNITVPLVTGTLLLL